MEKGMRGRREPCLLCLPLPLTLSVYKDLSHTENTIQMCMVSILLLNRIAERTVQ
jgi:hypothetical protein